MLTSPEAYQGVREAMIAAGLEPADAEITYRADNDVAVSGDTAKAVAKLLDRLEELDDVQNVYPMPTCLRMPTTEPAPARPATAAAGVTRIMGSRSRQPAHRHRDCRCRCPGP